MPTGLTHAVVGLGLTEVFMGPSPGPLLCGLSMALAAAPDLDILAFPLGIPYGAFFGHRGFFHSLFCAFVTGRYFFTWQPIEVSPIGLAFFGKWGLRVLISELLWVWLALACLVGTVWLVRSLSG